MIDTILDLLYKLAVLAIGWLPESPFANLKDTAGLSTFSEIMSWINYFVPIGTMLTIMTGYLTCVLLWYAARWVLRLVQFID